MRLSVTVAAALAGSAAASTLTPPLLPLIVRNPYLSTWLANARREPWSSWPTFYTGQEVGLSALVSVPESGTVYPLLGRAQDSLSNAGKDYNISEPRYLGSSFDASTTNLTYLIPPPPSSDYDTKPASLKLVFLSPITPTSTKRQSIPAGYILVEVESTFDLDFYIDVNGLWATGDRGSHIEWKLTHQQSTAAAESSLKTWTVWKTPQQLFTEYNDRSEWGQFHLTAPEHVTHQAGTSSLLRQRFAKHGNLTDSVDDKFRKVMDEEPVFAFAKSFRLGKKNGTTTTDSILFTIAHTQDPVSQFAAARGLTFMRPLWASWYSSAEELLTAHYHDYQFASKLAANYSQQLFNDGLRSGSSNYADIVSVSARQVLGATVFAGTPEEPVLFLKEISSDGNMQTVDVIYPAFPFFLYTNPRWLAYLLEPLLEYQMSNQYPNKYSLHDLGSHFPNATGHGDGHDEYMPVEECGNMLIMGLAVVNSLRYETPSASGSLWSALGDVAPLTADDGLFSIAGQQTRDGISGLDPRWGGQDVTAQKKSHQGERLAKEWVTRSYRIWKQWTSYLVEFSLLPANQLSTDDFAGWLANHTNLALKGIIGIKAMADLAEVAGEKKQAAEYDKIGREYIAKWEEYATSRDGLHTKLAYTWHGSWTTTYNMFADALLCFHLENNTKKSGFHLRGSQQPLFGDVGAAPEPGFVPRRVYTRQSRFYPTVMQRYGLPLDSRHLYTKSDWEFFTAAISSNKTRTQILNAVAVWVNETSTDKPLTDLYETEGTGYFPDPYFYARPVVGGHFSFLALERACNGKAVEGLKFLDEDEKKHDEEMAEMGMRGEL